MILYFTGCGNSGYVASRLAELLGDRNVVRLTAETMAANPQIEDERVVWVMPVYSWGVPPVVARFIKQADIKAGTHHHLVLTCGDDAGYADRQWQRLIERKGAVAITASTVIMPNTYVLMKGFDVDPKELEQKKLSAAETRITEVATAIKEPASAKMSADIVRGRFAWFKSRVIYPWFKRFAMSPKPFHYTEACVGCGKCARVCPMANIAMANIAIEPIAKSPSPTADPSPTAKSPATAVKRPVWSDNCALCLACYNACPHHAVAYGRSTPTKGQYFNPAFHQ